MGGTNINLYEALSECDHRLVRFGGHKAAAGLTISEREVDAFRGDFNEAVAKQWTEKEIVPEIVIDAEATLGQLNLDVLKQMEMLGPFGASNPRPVLYCRNVELDQPARKMGGGDRHLTVNLRQGKKVVRGVAFGAGDWCDELNANEGPIEIAYRPVVNDFNGFRKVEIHLVDWRPASTLATV